MEKALRDLQEAVARAIATWGCICEESYHQERLRHYIKDAYVAGATQAQIEQVFEGVKCSWRA